MPLKEEFEKTGNFLFRWRSYLPLLVIALFLIVFRNFKYPYNSHTLDLLWETMCMLISFSGLFVRAYTVSTIPGRTSGRHTSRQVAESLNTAGMYSIVRHPLYLGNFLIFLGVFLFPRVWWFTLLCVTLFMIYYERIMFAEESFLLNKFGQEYHDWASKTPAFFPRIKNWKPPTFSFSLRIAIKKEYHGFFAIIAAFTLLEVLGDLYLFGKLRIDIIWMILFLFGLLTYLIVRFIRKKTRLLNVQGR